MGDGLESPVLPIDHVLLDLAQISVGIEVGGEILPVVTAVHVNDVDRIDPVEEMLLGMGTKHIDHAGVEADA